MATDEAALTRRAGGLFAPIDIDPSYLDAFLHQLAERIKQRAFIAIAPALETELIVMNGFNPSWSLGLGSRPHE